MRPLLFILSAIAAVLHSSNAPPQNAATSLEEQSQTDKQVGYIDAYVATLQTNPNKPRTIDAPALTNPALIQKWLQSMTVKQYLNLTDDSRNANSGLDGWYEIAVPDQPTPKIKLGYPGIVSFDDSYGEMKKSKPFADADKAATALIYCDAGNPEEFMRVSYDTRLPVIEQFGTAIQVAAPSGGSAYVSASNATVFESVDAIPYRTGEDLVNAAKLFLGRPYLWGGRYGFSLDGAGLTHTIYDANGITIGRDTDAQAYFTGHGRRIIRSDLQPGDIVFYASNLSDPKTIYHDGIGDGKMIEAYGAGIPTRITPVRFNKDRWGTERFLNGKYLQ